MNLFTILRMIFLVVFILLNTAILAAAAVNLATLGSLDALRHVEAFMVFYTTLSILFLFPVILVDVLRTGSLASKVWFECAWLSFAALCNLIAAAVGTGALTKCSPGSLSCAGSRILLPITWVATLVVSAQLALLVISATFYSTRYPDVWWASVRDFGWFNGGGAGKGSSLESGPPTPHFVPKQLGLTADIPQLAYMTEQWAASQRRVSVLPSAQKEMSSEPKPLTKEYAPELSSSRAPVHYNASAAISVGVLPERRPSRSRKPAPALYPTTVQIAINATSPSKVASMEPVPSPEPMPVQNWPRANPLELAMRQKITSVSIPVPSPSAPLSPVSRRPKHRPPPLDLTAALPGAKRR